eukprot:1793275-Amphidinium_carterae.1
MRPTLLPNFSPLSPKRRRGTRTRRWTETRSLRQRSLVGWARARLLPQQLQPRFPHRDPSLQVRRVQQTNLLAQPP